jgi:hypothetical protein
MSEENVCDHLGRWGQTCPAALVGVDLLCFCRNLDEGGSDILQLSGFGAVVGVAGGAADRDASSMSTGA